MKYILITGTSRGLGKGLAYAFLKEHNVIGISRSPSSLKDEFPAKYEHIFFDLSYLSKIESVIEDFFEKKRQQYPVEIQYLILNSGVLGKIQDMRFTSLEEIQYVMNVNVWSNKILLDTLFRMEKKKIIQGPNRILAISSGASISGNRGWNAYSLSKATLNMLIKLYAQEMPNKKFIALAPGLIHTKMQDQIVEQKIDFNIYPSFQRLYDARGTDAMPEPEKAGERIVSQLDTIFSFESGSYVDIRKI